MEGIESHGSEWKTGFRDKLLMLETTAWVTAEEKNSRFHEGCAGVYYQLQNDLDQIDDVGFLAALLKERTGDECVDYARQHARRSLWGAA